MSLSPFVYIFLLQQRIICPVVLRVVVGRYEDYGLQHPDHCIWEHHPTINNELLQFIKVFSELFFSSFLSPRS
jgi:hypothetical protein